MDPETPETIETAVDLIILHLRMLGEERAINAQTADLAGTVKRAKLSLSALDLSEKMRTQTLPLELIDSLDSSDSRKQIESLAEKSLWDLAAVSIATLVRLKYGNLPTIRQMAEQQAEAVRNPTLFDAPIPQKPTPAGAPKETSDLPAVVPPPKETEWYEVDTADSVEFVEESDDETDETSEDDSEDEDVAYLRKLAPAPKEPKTVELDKSLKRGRGRPRKTPPSSETGTLI